jgi:hypothetical protein
MFQFPLVTAKLLGDYFDKSQYGANRTFLSYTAPIYLPTESLERKKRWDPNQKKSASSNCFIPGNSLCGFGPHRHCRNKKEWYTLNNTK